MVGATNGKKDMTAGRYFYAKLTADSGVTDLVGTRIYPVIAPQDPTLPYVTYTTAGEPADLNKTQAATADNVTLVGRAWATTYTACEDIEIAVRAAVDFVKGTAGGATIDFCQYVGYSEGIEEGSEIFFRQFTYVFRVKR